MSSVRENVALVMRLWLLYASESASRNGDSYSGYVGSVKLCSFNIARRFLFACMVDWVNNREPYFTAL